MRSKIANRINLVHLTMYTSYREYSKKKIPKEFRIKGRGKVIKLISSICKHIGLNMVRRTSGAYIKGLGYFFIWKIPRKMAYSVNIKGGTRVKKYNYHSNQHMYSPIYMSFKGRTNGHDILRNWSMDNTFYNKLRLELKDNIYKGKKYKNYMYSLSKIY